MVAPSPSSTSPSPFIGASVPELIRQSRQGISYERVDKLAGWAGLRVKELATALGVSVRSLHGKAATDLLPQSAGERLLLLEQLIDHALAVFDGQMALVSAWLRVPLAELAIREGEPVLSFPTTSTRDMGRFDEPFALAETAVHDRQRTQQQPMPHWQTPLGVLDTVLGYTLVNNVLGRIEAGVFS